MKGNQCPWPGRLSLVSKGDRYEMRRKNEEGAALILAIFATVILTVLAVGLTQIVRAELMASRAGYDRARARSLAKAGFTLACSSLMYDDKQDVDSFADMWSLLESDGSLELNDGTCTTTVIDTCSLINVNTANLDLLTTVTGDTAIAQAIVDWRKQYGPFHSLGELVQIDGMTRDWLADKAEYLTVDSRERNVNADGEARVNINTDDSNALQRGLGIQRQEAQRIVNARRSLPDGTFASLGDLAKTGVLQVDRLKQLADRISLDGRKYASGRININTASQDVLLTLPGVTSEFVDAVIERQEQAKAAAESGADQSETTAGGQQQAQGAFRSAGEILDLPGIAGLSDEAKANLLGMLCTKSSTYLIESDATLDDRDIHVVLQGVILRRDGDTPVIYGWREIPQPMYIGRERNGTGTSALQ